MGLASEPPHAILERNADGEVPVPFFNRLLTATKGCGVSFFKNTGGALLCVMFCGCVSWDREDNAATSDSMRKPADSTDRRSAENDRARKAIEAAAVAEVVRQTNVPPDQLEAHADRDRDEWRVVVNFRPATSRKHYFLRLSNGGEVVECLPGL